MATCNGENAINTGNGIIRSHCSTTYVDVAYCYRLSSVVCRFVSPVKTAELTEMPFGLWTLVGLRNHVLDGVQIPHRKGQFLGEKGQSIVKHREYCPRVAAMRPFVNYFVMINCSTSCNLPSFMI